MPRLDQIGPSGGGRGLCCNRQATTRGGRGFCRGQRTTASGGRGARRRQHRRRRADAPGTGSDAPADSTRALEMRVARHQEELTAFNARMKALSLTTDDAPSD